MSISLRLSMIAVMLLAASALGILSYSILNAKEPEAKPIEVVAPVQAPPEPPKKKVSGFQPAKTRRPFAS